MHPKDAVGMVNSVDPDQTAATQSDLDLHCLLRPLRIIFSNFVSQTLSVLLF